MSDVFIGETGGWSYFSLLPAKTGGGWNLCFDGEKLEIPLCSTDVGGGAVWQPCLPRLARPRRLLSSEICIVETNLHHWVY